MVINETEKPVIVTSRSVSCDGGIGLAGHPNVYLNIGDENEVVCPYCSRVFILDRDFSDSFEH